MRNQDYGRFAEKREEAGSYTVGSDAEDYYLTQQCMVNGSRLFGGRAIYLANDKKVYESTANTANIWFSRFMMGAKRRMGVMRRQYEALTVDQIILIGDIAEEDWSKSNS